MPTRVFLYLLKMQMRRERGLGVLLSLAKEGT